MDPKNALVSVNVDESVIREMCLTKISEVIKEADSEFVFWDAAELKRRTCMCWNTIQDQFFFDKRFPKRKVGSKWYFPAKETRLFLVKWLEEQSVG